MSKQAHSPIAFKNVIAQHEAQTAVQISQSVRAMMLPEDNPAVRLPDDNVAASALFEAKEVFSATSTTNDSTSLDESIIIAYPKIHNAAYQLLDAIVPAGKGVLKSLGDGVIGISYSNGDVLCIPRPVMTGTDIAVCRVPNYNGRQINFESNFMVRFDFYGNADVFVRSVAVFGQVSTTIDSDIVYARISTEYPIDDSCYASLEITDIDGGVIVPNPTSFKRISFSSLENMDKTYRQRCTALSLLATYQGSDLANGGQIAAARLPRGMCLSDLGRDVYEGVASLPVYNADYSLSSGAYVWWLPDDQSEWFFKPYLEESFTMYDTTSIIIAANRDDSSQSVRVRLVGHFETLTRSQQYHTEVTSFCPMLPQMIALAKHLPAATENPTHKAFFGKVWKKFKGVISNPANWIKAGQYGLAALSALL